MRLIKTFILRFYSDTDHQDQFCGDLRALPGNKSMPFKNISDLLALLFRVVNKDGSNASIPDIQDEIESDITK